MKYRVVGPVASFAAGQELNLSKGQIEARAHRLEAVDKRGKVRATGPIQFKKGETITLATKFEKLAGSLKAVLLPESEAKKLNVRAAEGDELILDVEATVNGEPFPDCTETGQPYVLGSGAFPELESVLMGSAIGDSVTVTKALPDDYSIQEYAGADIVMIVAIKEISTPKKSKAAT